jgi:hypothetical protein
MGVGALKSDQETNRTAVPVVMNDYNTKGVVHRAYFSGTVAGADVAIGTTIALVRLPNGARVLGGVWINSADFGVAATTISIGDSGAAGRFATALAVAAANARLVFPEDGTVALTGDGYVLTADTTILVTTAGGVIVAAGTYKGWIDYVQEK